jgi:hypothetical protein
MDFISESWSMRNMVDLEASLQLSNPTTAVTVASRRRKLKKIVLAQRLKFNQTRKNSSQMS